MQHQTFVYENCTIFFWFVCMSCAWKIENGNNGSVHEDIPYKSHRKMFSLVFIFCLFLIGVTESQCVCFLFLFQKRHDVVEECEECEQFLWVLLFLLSTDIVSEDHVESHFLVFASYSLGCFAIGFANDPIVWHIPTSS